MSNTYFAIGVLAAFAGGLALAAIIIWLVGRESEETPRTRRLALGRAAARARAQTPPAQSTKMVDRGNARMRRLGPTKVVVDERMPRGVVAFRGPGGQVVTAPIGALDVAGLEARGYEQLTEPLYIGRGYDNVRGHSEAGDGGWVDEANAEIKARHAKTVQRVQERVDELETEQELAARVAIGGAHAHKAASSQIYLELAPGVSVGVDRDEAYALDHDGFVKLYRRHVYGASKGEARIWADEQLRRRLAYQVGGDAA